MSAEPEPPRTPTVVRLARRVVTAPIVLYRRVLSPLKPPTCRFSPTCSAYAHEAILRHGVIRGGALAAWRILRCQPFARGGYDPVPGTAPSGDRDHESGNT
jgi:putative membrane protein insertion efficiency factor